MIGREQFRVDGMQAAADVLAARGFGGVRAHELARVARMSVGTLYREYASKAGFARAVRGISESELTWTASRAWLSTEDTDGDFRAPFQAFFRSLCTWALEQWGPFVFTYLHFHADTQAEETQARALVLEVLGAGLSQGALRPAAPWVLAGLVWGAVAELTRASHARGAPLTDAELDEAAHVLWCALRREGGGVAVQAGCKAVDVEAAPARLSPDSARAAAGGEDACARRDAESAPLPGAPCVSTPEGRGVRGADVASAGDAADAPCTLAPRPDWGAFAQGPMLFRAARGSPCASPTPPTLLPVPDCHLCDAPASAHPDDGECPLPEGWDEDAELAALLRGELDFDVYHRRAVVADRFRQRAERRAASGAKGPARPAPEKGED